MSDDRDDFKAWDNHPQKVHPCRPRDNLKVNWATFYNAAANRDSFCHARAQVRESFRLGPSTPPTRDLLPFDGTTSYRLQYVPHPVQPRKPRERPLYRPNGGGWPAEPLRSFKPRVAWETNPAAIEGTTKFGEPLKTWSLPPRPRPRPRAKEDGYRPAGGETAHISTSRADYVEHRGCPRARSARPAPEAWGAAGGRRGSLGAPLTSTMREDYKAWAVVVAPQQELEHSTGPTTRHPPQRSVSCKPRPKPPEPPRPLLEAPSIAPASQPRRLPDGWAPPRSRSREEKPTHLSGRWVSGSKRGSQNFG
ncbi:hypothetical protein CRUP_014543 [Coryphaenoides rupestris]|nr:hypothetical protein CRUP_014543 [Coryphaenoides rupestris]